MDAPGILPPAVDFEKLAPEYAELQLIHAEEEWAVLEVDLKGRLIPVASTALNQIYTYQIQLQDLYSKLVQGKQNLCALTNEFLEMFNDHFDGICCFGAMTTSISIKTDQLDALVKSLSEVYNSDHEQAVVKELTDKVLNCMYDLSHSFIELDQNSKKYMDTLHKLVPLLATSIYETLQLTELTSLIVKIGNNLTELEAVDPQMLLLVDLEFVGTLIVEYDKLVDWMLPLADAFIKMLKRFPKASAKQIPNIFRNYDGYAARHMKLCRLYAAIHLPSNALNLAELDIDNEEMFNWRRFREEFFYFYNLNTKADSDLRVYQAMFGEGYNSSSSLTFSSIVGKRPLDLVQETTASMLVNYPNCPHDIANPLFMTLTASSAYFCPSVSLSASPHLCDGVVTVASKIATSDSCLIETQTPHKKYLLLNPKGLEVMREHIYNIFVAALRTKCTTIVLVNVCCDICQLHPAQLAVLYKEASLVFKGRGLTQIAVADSELFIYIEKLSTSK